MDRVGLPLFPALKKVDDILTEHDVHNRLKIIASCKMVGDSLEWEILLLAAPTLIRQAMAGAVGGLD